MEWRGTTGKARGEPQTQLLSNGSNGPFPARVVTALSKAYGAHTNLCTQLWQLAVATSLLDMRKN